MPLDRERPRWDVRRAGTAADLARNHRAEWFTECATYDRYGRAKQLAKNLLVHFERIDAAAKEKDASLAANQFQEALKDFDAFLNIVPS